MRAIRVLALLLVLPLAASATQSAPAVSEDADDWKMIGGMLALVQQFIHLAASSPDPAAAQKGVDAMLSGSNEQANRLAAGVMEEVLQDVPAEQRGVFVAIGRDLLTLARREQARIAATQAPSSAPPQPAAASPEQSRDAALLARKELHAMGLRYWDEQQFLAAVRRGDRIAVELFLAAKGLEARPGG